MRIVALAIAVTMFITSAWAGDPLVGTWKRNAEKSKSALIDLSRPSTHTFTQIPGGVRLQVGPRSVDLICDGKEHAVVGGTNMRETTGADTYTATRRDNSTLEITYLREGKVVSTTRHQVSSDGRVLTMTSDGVSKTGEKFHDVLIYEKQ